MAEAIKGELGFFLKPVASGSGGGVDLGLNGGSVGGNNVVGIEGSFDFVLDFVTVREEAALEELLCLQVDGVFGNFTADNAADVLAEVGVKGGGPRSEGGV